MPGKIHVWTSRKHHTPRGYQGQEHMTRKCHQFPQKGPKNWPQNQHFAQKFCKMLLGFGPLWPLWPPRLAPLAPSLVRLWPPRLAPLAPWLGPFGPLAWPLWPPGLFGPRLPESRGQGAKGPKPNNLQCNFFQFLMTANGFSWHGGLSVYKCVLWMKKILTFSAFPTDNSYFSKLIP